MIGDLALVVGAALVTYATRWAGFALAARVGAGHGNHVLRAFDRFLAWAPVAAFSALIVPDVASGPGALAARLAGVALAAIAIWRVGRLWVGLAAGFGGFWIVELLARG
jgi:branched-subunit amino acid transport protein